MRTYIVPSTADLPIPLFISPQPNFRVELFGRAPSPSSPTRRLNPDRLDHKADQLSRPVSPIRPNHPQAPQRSATPLPLPRSHGRRQHESIPRTSRTWRLLEHSRESSIHAAPSAPQHPRAPDRQRPPFPPRSLARDSKGPLPRPVCRQSGSLPRTAPRLCFGPGLNCHINPAGALVPRSKISSTVTAHQAALQQTANGTETGLVLCPFFVFFLLFRSRPIHHAATPSTSAGSDF